MLGQEDRDRDGETWFGFTWNEPNALNGGFPRNRDRTKEISDKKCIIDFNRTFSRSNLHIVQDTTDEFRMVTRFLVSPVPSKVSVGYHSLDCLFDDNLDPTPVPENQPSECLDTLLDGPLGPTEVWSRSLGGLVRGGLPLTSRSLVFRQTVLRNVKFCYGREVGRGSCGSFPCFFQYTDSFTEEVLFCPYCSSLTSDLNLPVVFLPWKSIYICSL